MKAFTRKNMFKSFAARTISIITILSFLLVNVTMFVAADDGTIFRRNVSSTPEDETEHAAFRMLPVYIPPQTAAGEVLEGVDIINAEGAVVETREYVQPLVVHYVDGPVVVPEDSGGFPGHGERDAFAGVSLDGGLTWKNTNLSKSADLSSFKFKDGKKWVNYPGDVGRTFLSSDGNQVMVVWVSRYASGGSPTYAMTDDQRALVADYLVTKGVITDATACTDGDLVTTPCPYLEDHFGVSGSQGYSDLADEGYPTVGILPYAALWVARGVLIPPEATGLETSTFVWFKPERLSSAKRDANRPEIACVKGAGCALTWQEDPEGIRPGDGEGPGEGWAGAVAHHETDIWYSYINWDDFPLVADATAGYGTLYNTTGDLAEWIAANPTGSPSAAIPMAIPVRVSDNAMCTDLDSEPYCMVDFDGSGTPDFCASTVPVTLDTPEGPTTDVNMCVAEDGRLMRGNTASTRARLGLHGYSSQCLYDPLNPETCPIDSAWFYVLYEENKGLGEDGEDLEVSDDPALKIDMGKNVWYHTFDMNKPELASQGLIMNQPAIYPDDWSDTSGLLSAYTETDYNFYQIEPDPVYETLAGLDTTLLQSEIARRPSNLSQDWYDVGETGTVAFQTWKQGIIRRGGPADVMARRFVMPMEEVTTTTYLELQPSFEVLVSTTYETKVITRDCTQELKCEPNARNPLYNYSGKVCRATPDAPQCFKYITPDGEFTNDPVTCTMTEVCVETITFEPVTYCDAATDENCVVTQVWEPTDVCDVNDTVNCRSEFVWVEVEWCDATYPDMCTSSTTTQLALDPETNPYDYANMECLDANGESAWLFTDGANPRYVKGLCAAPALNMSGNTILTSETCGDATTCLEAFPFNDYFDDKAIDADPISKIFTWQMYGPGYDGVIPTENNLDDPSWENPYDMAKGHRGFMTGDMVMLLYAWTPNWNALTGGHDVVNLYIRRSFDGGVTWSTLPASYEVGDVTYNGDGTTTCEWWMDAEGKEYPVCTEYTAGQFEQARNVSQLVGSAVTVIDPRYAPTTRSITEASVTTASLPVGFTAPLYPDDTRDPSRYFIVYETGANSAYDEGEATPLDLFYSRAVDWGDDYLVWQDIADTSACLPSADGEDEYDLTGFCNEFDALEGDRLNESGEAAMMGSPGGMFMHAVWNQIDFTKDGIEILSDAIWRRVLFLDDYIPLE